MKPNIWIGLKAKLTNGFLEEFGGWIVVFGLVVEIVFEAVINGDKPWREWVPLVLANVIIAAGVWIEIHFGGNVRAEAEARTAEANERASVADKARIELEKQLTARTITEEQFKILQKLKGVVPAVIVASEADAEPAWFASVLASALQRIGLEVGLVTRAPHAHGTVNFVCDRYAFFNPNGEPTQGEPLVSILEEAGIPIKGVCAVRPMDLPDDNPDVPMIIIGGRFTIAPDSPYLGEDIVAPHPTMVERMRNP